MGLNRRSWMRIPSLVSRLFMGCLCLLTPEIARGQPDTRTLAKQAAFIFTGEVESTRDADQISLPLPPKSVIVRVADVVYVKPAVAVRPGDLVIVQLRSEALPPARTRTVFYTNGWGYG